MPAVSVFATPTQAYANQTYLRTAQVARMVIRAPFWKYVNQVHAQGAPKTALISKTHAMWESATPPRGHCEAQALENGTSCDDGNECTSGDNCWDGSCRSGVFICTKKTDSGCGCSATTKTHQRRTWYGCFSVWSGAVSTDAAEKLQKQPNNHNQQLQGFLRLYRRSFLRF